MYTATVKNVASAKNNAPAIYCESKSGNIYKLKQQVPLQQHARLISQIRSAKVINIQHWIKVKEGTYIAKPAKAQLLDPPSDAELEEMEIQASIDTANARSIAAKKGWKTRRSNAEDIEHAIKMCEFEESGDREGMLAYLEARTTPEMKAIEARIAQQVAS
jgi:hypothetical protein